MNRLLNGLPANLPAPLRDCLSGYSGVPQTIGRSGAGVLRLSAEGQPDLFLKTEPLGPFCELPAETERLSWLADQHLPAPRVRAATDDGRDAFLLMSAVPGTDLASTPNPDPARIIDTMVAALRTLHETPVYTCPFDRRLDVLIGAAEQRVRAGVVDESDFDEERLGRTAEELFAELLATRPAHEVIVVCHGDACLPNVMSDGGRFSGIVDCGRLGLADRHADLALAARSLNDNLGTDCTQDLFQAYGLTPDPKRIAFYQLLDEFF